jgi:glycosyltransferase involved in cell wall biosynthesis
VKIVHLSNYFQPKLGYQEYYLAKEQLRRGHDVFVVTSERYFPFPGYDEYMKSVLGNRIIKAGEFVEEGVKVIRLNVIFEMYHQIWLSKLYSTIKKLHPDVVHMHNCGNISALRTSLIKRKLNFNLLCDEHSHLSIIRKRNIIKRAIARIYKVIIKNILKNVDCFVAIAPDVKNVMTDIYGLPENRINIIPLGVDTDLFYFCERSRNEIRQKFDIGENVSVIVYAGKLITDKGPHLLVKAVLDILRNKKVELKVLLIGDGNRSYIEGIKKEIKLSKLDNFFIWHKFVEKTELYRFYSAADIGVWPLEESIGMLEASACKLPVIVKDSESLHDRLSFDNGIAYREGDVESLKGAILRIVGNKQVRWEMGERALDLVKEKYSWKKISEAFIKLYGSPASLLET